MNTHTPGPWDVFPNPTTGKVTVGPVEHHSNLVKCVAECYADEMPNAWLIAAAPDLLAALEWALTHVRFAGGPEGDAEAFATRYNAAQGAIAKAKGEA